MNGLRTLVVKPKTHPCLNQTRKDWGTRPARKESVEGSLRRALDKDSREILFVAHG